MGARHSRKSMDVTTTPKKDGVAESGDAGAVGDGKLERIEEADVKPTTNGTATHTDTTTDDKDVIKDKDSVCEKEKEKDTDNKDDEKKVNSVAPKIKKHFFSFKKTSDDKDDKEKDKETVNEKETEKEAKEKKVNFLSVMAPTKNSFLNLLLLLLDILHVKKNFSLFSLVFISLLQFSNFQRKLNPFNYLFKKPNLFFFFLENSNGL